MVLVVGVVVLGRRKGVRGVRGAKSLRCARILAYGLCVDQLLSYQPQLHPSTQNLAAISRPHNYTLTTKQQP